MTDLFINETKNTPKLIFDSKLNEWEITGRSYPKEAAVFYSPLLDWLAKFEKTSDAGCGIKFKLEFFNTTSSKILIHLLIRLRVKKENGGTEPVIKWYYERDDEDMKETGESLMEISKLKFELIPF